MYPAAQLPDAVVCGGRTFGNSPCAGKGVLDLGARERVDEIGLEGEIDLRPGRQRGGALEQPRGAVEVQPADRGQARRHRPLAGRQRLDGAAVEDLALDRAALEHGPLGRRELVEPGGEQRLERRRDDHLAAPVAVVRHHQHLADEQRVPPGRPRDLLA